MNSRLDLSCRDFPEHAFPEHTFPDNTARVVDLRATGIPGSTIDHRCRSGGPWQRLLPGVVLLDAGEPNRRQRIRAAALYGGDDAVVTGVDALAAHGVVLAETREVHLLLPHGKRRRCRDFVLTERTTRLPLTTCLTGIRFAAPARAALDAARRQADPGRIAELLGAPVRQGVCTVPELRHELEAGGQRGSAAPRAMLKQLATGVRSITEQQAHRVVAGCPVPTPQWNVPLINSSGALLGVVDAWWPDVGLVWDFGAQEFRIPADATPVHRNWHSTLLAHQVTILRTPPQRLHQDPAAIRRALLVAYFRAGRKPPPSVYAAANRCSLGSAQRERPVG